MLELDFKLPTKSSFILPVDVKGMLKPMLFDQWIYQYFHIGDLISRVKADRASADDQGRDSKSLHGPFRGKKIQQILNVWGDIFLPKFPFYRSSLIDTLQRAADSSFFSKGKIP